MEPTRHTGGTAAPPATQPWSWRSVVLFLLTAVVFLTALAIAAPFVAALTWAIALATSAQRPYRWLLRKVQRPNIAALLATLAVMLVIVAPVVLVLERLVSELFSLVPLVTGGQVQNWLQSTMQQYPKLNDLCQRATAGVDFHEATSSAAAYAAGKLQGVLTSTVGTLTQIAIMLYTLFFLFRDGKAAKEALLSILPMSSGEANNLVERMRSAVEASILGSLTIAAIQGALGGIIFAILSVPNALLWAFVMGALATIPSLGTFLVWAPVAVFLLLSGHVVKAAILFAFGACVIGSVDNLLYPTLVSGKLQMHTVAVFFGVLGGVVLFGISGVVLGPLVLVCATELLRMWQPAALRTSVDAE